MSKNGTNRADFIQLYRRRLQNDLDDMGYPGGKEMDAGNRPAYTNGAMIIDAESELSSKAEDFASRTSQAAVRQ